MLTTSIAMTTFVTKVDILYKSILKMTQIHWLYKPKSFYQYPFHLKRLFHRMKIIFILFSNFGDCPIADRQDKQFLSKTEKRQCLYTLCTDFNIKFFPQDLNFVHGCEKCLSYRYMYQQNCLGQARRTFSIWHPGCSS